MNPQQTPRKRPTFIGSDIRPRRQPVAAANRPQLAMHKPMATTPIRPQQAALVPPSPPHGTLPLTAPTPVTRPLAPAPRQTGGQAIRKDFQPPSTDFGKPNLWSRVQLPLIIILGMVGGVLVQSPQIGQVLIAIYGLVAFIFRIESRTSFVVALLSLLTTVIAAAVQHNSMLAQTFAGYALLLFGVGIICAAREIREQRNLLIKKRGAARRY